MSRRAAGAGPAAPVPRLLFLPAVGTGYADNPPAGSVSSGPGGRGHPRLGTEPADAGALFWFRWIGGHQLSFLIWRTMADLLAGAGDDRPDARTSEELTGCVDGYTAMLLYASTVPRELYHAHLRPRMALQHPAFSGTWAPDYRPVARLLRGRSPWLDDPDHASLAAAVDRNRAVHDDIADHLVPDGRSLLRTATGTAGAAVSRDKEDLFDNFFLTIRRPTGRVDMAEQFHDRLDDAARDLTRHGLYPRVHGRHHPVLGPDADPGTRRLVDDVPATLWRAAVPLGRTLQDAR